MRALTLTAAALWAALACSRGQAVPAEPAPDAERAAAAAGDTLRVPFGAAAVHAPSGVRATFLALVSDSRCPTDALCVWAGDAVVRLRLERGGAALDTALHWSERPPSGAHAATVDGWEVTFFGLTPAPASSAPPPADAARTALLLVRRAGR